MLNKAQLIGRLGKNPETRNTQDGTSVTRFSLATETRWNDSEGHHQSRTEWHNVVAWGRLAEICAEHLKKGRLVFVEGRIQSRQWEDNESNRHHITEIVIHDMKMLEPRQPVEVPVEAVTAEEHVPF